MPVHLLVVAGTFLFVIAVLLMAISLQKLSTLFILAILPALVLLAVNPEVWLAIIIALYQSSITLPWLPSNANLFQVFAFLFSGLMVFYGVLSKTAQHRKTTVRKWVILFAVVLAAVISVRGIGIKYFGSALWGGSSYILLFVTIALYLYGDLVTLSAKQWRFAAVGLFVLSFMPLIAQLIYSLSGGRITEQYSFVQPLGFVAMMTDEMMSGDQGVARYQSDGGVFMMMIPLFFAKPFKGPFLLLSIACWGAALVVTSFTGFRSGMITSILIPAAWLFWGEKKINTGRSVMFIFFSLVALVVAALNARHFPLSVQRALSFVPFADVSVEAMSNASATMDWRLEVWRRAIVEVLPRHWLIGQGLAFDPRDLQEITALGLFAREWAFVTRSYHNGPLSLILVLGLPGAIAGFGFIYSTLREYHRTLRDNWSDPVFFRMYRVTFAWYSVLVFNFCTTYGDVQVSFPRFFFIAMILEGMSKARARMERGKAELHDGSEEN